MAENRKYNWFEKTFGKPTNWDKCLATLIAGAGVCFLIAEGCDYIFQKQAERWAMPGMQEVGLEQNIDEAYSNPISIRQPTQADLYPSEVRALQNSATNPNMPYANDFDYIPEMKNQKGKSSGRIDYQKSAPTAPFKPVPANQQEQSYTNEDKTLLAKMIFGEARDCDEEAKIAVAYTAINRLKDSQKKYGSSLKELILKDRNYSCFNLDDPNKNKLLDPQSQNAEAWQDCIRVADNVLTSASPDPTNGADHYFCFYEFKNQERKDNQVPYWAKGQKPTRIIAQKGCNVRKELRFYNL